MIFRRVTLQTSSKTTFAKNAHTFAKTFYSIIYTMYNILFSKYIFHHNLMELGRFITTFLVRILIPNKKNNKYIERTYLSWAKIQGGAMSEMLGSSWISPWLVYDSRENFLSLIFLSQSSNFALDFNEGIFGTWLLAAEVFEHFHRHEVDFSFWKKRKEKVKVCN